MNRRIVTSILPFLALGMPITRHFPDPVPDPGGEGGAKPPPVGTPPAPPAPPPAPPSGNVGDPGWLNERVAQAKRAEREAVLKEMGVSDPEAAKKAIAKAKELEDASKSELERKDAELKTANVKASERDAYHIALTKRADSELASFTAEQQTKIKAIAGDDPVKILEAADLARAMGGAPVPVAAPGAIPPAPTKPPLPPAANTTGAAGGSPPSAPTSPTDHKAVWEGLKAKDPMAAASYLNRYGGLIYPDTPNAT